ncbi:prepilin-type N-terminal cleavage/methylation domain-containing protein [Patescibacteria group bacterium]|nr:prepilin-type N-terminal cleavage/methylation domain-containing protein [Patescibacteria group bacterium]
MKHNGFTLIELLIVIAISMILIGFAITGSKSLQSQQVLQSSVSNFISKLNFIRSEAVSGVHNFNGKGVLINNSTTTTNWVYGFYVIPANSVSSSCTSDCLGYDVVMAVKDIQLGSSCNDQNSNNTPTYNNTVPPLNNSLYNNVSTNTYTGSVSPLSSCIGGNNGFNNNSITPTGYTYFHALSPGVEISASSFPMFEEISGYIYIYNNGTWTIASALGNSVSSTLTFSYQGYQENVYINDVYNASNADNIGSGGIRYE